MLHPDGIEIYLKDAETGERFTEYADASRSSDNESLGCFVEAVTAQRFEIEVWLLKGFRKYNAPVAKVRYEVDDESSTNYVKLPLFTTLPKVVHTRSQLRFYRNGQWMKGFLSFGNCNIEEKPLGNTPEKSETHGLIRVSSQRGRSTKRERPIICKPSGNGGLQLDRSISLKSSLANGITHQVHFRDASKSNAYANKTNFTPIGGTHGELISFEFRYRSRDYLQRLNLIPRDGISVAEESPQTTDAASVPKPEHTVKAEPKQSTRLVEREHPDGITIDSTVDENSPPKRSRSATTDARDDPGRALRQRLTEIRKQQLELLSAEAEAIKAELASQQQPEPQQVAAVKQEHDQSRAGSAESPIEL